MKDKWKKKLQSRAGESLAETLVSMLIASIALVMLAGAMSASLGMATRSKHRLGEYYTENEAVSGVVQMKSGGTSVTEGIKIVDDTNKINVQEYDVTVFINDKFSNNPVISYKKVTETE